MNALKLHILVLIVSVGMTSCGSPSQIGPQTVPAPAPSIQPSNAAPTSSPTVTAAPPFDYADLLGDLRASGVKVESAGDVTIPFFSVKGHLIRVNDNDIQVFEFEDPDLASTQLVALEAARNAMVSGTVTPSPATHIYEKGRLIAVYVGSDGNVKSVLQKIMGPQLAGD